MISHLTMFILNHTVSTDEVVEVYDHVHHATTLRLLERARLAHVESIGYSNDRLLESGVFLVISSLEVRYKRELLLGDELEVTCENCFHDRKLVRVEQRIIKPRGRVAVEATIDMVCMSGETRRAMAPPEDFIAAFLATNESGG
jgi:acyl-CoA thioester hydrolase